MRNSFIGILTALIVLMTVSCATITVPTGVTNNPIGQKTGTASGMIILGLFGTANASVYEAAKNGGITTISTVDTETILYFGGIVMKVTTTVTGE
ncbi:MAG: TRL-like family protein [Treponema sp.]|jgi:hypothetical protein|nr:TRL-like family protein [Treponema sp.]